MLDAALGRSCLESASLAVFHQTAKMYAPRFCWTRMVNEEKELFNLVLKFNFALPYLLKITFLRENVGLKGREIKYS